VRRLLDEVEKLHARAGVVLKHPEHGTRDRHRVLLFDATHRHAQMRRFHHHGDAERANFFSNRLRDLIRETFLDLKAASEDIDEARDLAEADDPSLRNVGDVAPAEKRQQVMLAEAVEVDVLDDHHLVIIDGEERIVEDGVDICGVTAGEKVEGLLHSFWCVEQPFA
jgi:hypothetical protein